MALTAADWQRLILLEVGAGLDGGSPVERKVLDQVTPNIALLWAAWVDKAQVFPRLQYLYCKRHCLLLLIGQMRDLVSTTINGYNANQEQKLKNLQDMHKDVGEEIKLVEAQARASRPIVLGTLTTTAARMAASGEVDPNDPVYRGDALTRPNLNSGII